MAQERLSIQQEEELRKLLSAANLYRMRGKWLDAENQYRAALNISPKDVRVRNMLIDVLVELGKTELAISEAKIAMELIPGNAQLETKYAKLVLQRGEAAYQTILAEDMLAHPAKYMDQTRKPGIALVCSLFGLGQLYNHEYVKSGIIMGAMWLFVIAFAVLEPQVHLDHLPSLADLLKIILNPVVAVLGIIATVAWVYGVVDAWVTSNKTNKENNPLAR